MTESQELFHLLNPAKENDGKPLNSVELSVKLNNIDTKVIFKRFKGFYTLFAKQEDGEPITMRINAIEGTQKVPFVVRCLYDDDRTKYLYPSTAALFQSHLKLDRCMVVYFKLTSYKEDVLTELVHLLKRETNKFE